MKKLTYTFAAFAMTTMLTGASAYAQDPAPQPAPAPAPAPAPEQDQRPAPELQVEQDAKASIATGELVNVDAAAMTLTVKGVDGSEWTFDYTNETDVTGGQEGVAGLATQAGTNVTVHFADEGGKKVATRIDIAAR